MDYTIRVAKTKEMYTAELICAFVFAQAKSGFSHDEAQMVYIFCMLLKYKQ